MHADIHKCAEAGHVSHNTFQAHAWFEVSNFLDPFLEGCGFELRARIATRLFQFTQNVLHCRQSKSLVSKLSRVKLAQCGCITNQCTHVPTRIRENPMHYRISLRMH